MGRYVFGKLIVDWVVEVLVGRLSFELSMHCTYCVQVLAVDGGQ